MRFWDSSALVALVVEEAASISCRRILREDRELGVWAMSRVEIVSAIRRNERAGRLDPAQVAAALGRLEALALRWTEVDGLDPVRERAERLLGGHALHAADAAQLAAALVLFRDRPRHRVFVCADAGLVGAAMREGFETRVPR